MCQIKWIGKDGVSTQDDKPAIGRVRCKQFKVAKYSGQSTGEMTGYSQWFDICADHAKRLNDPGMEIWEFQALEA